MRGAPTPRWVRFGSWSNGPPGADRKVAPVVAPCNVPHRNLLCNLYLGRLTV